MAPVVNHLRRQLLKRDILHCDETPIQILKEKERKSPRRSLICGSTEAEMTENRQSSFMTTNHLEAKIMQRHT